MAAPVKIPNTTLVCVDCQYPLLAERAIRLSLEQCSYESVKLLTDDTTIAPRLSSEVEVVPIRPIRSLTEYSDFMVKRLVGHVETDFVQVIQWDGYVVDGKAWSDAFFEFDYIGARWWFRNDRSVGNGGFSLRSRRLLQALQDAEIQVTDAEDTTICVSYRDLLEERHGIRFASAQVADRYAFEGVAPKFPVFGFHRLFNFPYFYDRQALARLVDALPDALFCTGATVSMIAVLIDLKREQEALRYAWRLQRSGDALKRLHPDLVTRFGQLFAWLNRTVGTQTTQQKERRVHPSALINAELFFKTYLPAPTTPTKIVEVGSQDVNGSLRSVCPPNVVYVGVDFAAGKGVDIVLSDPYQLPFDDNSVDVCLSSAVFEHSEMFWLLFTEILRILKPRGLFYLNAPSNGPFHRFPVDCWRFYPDSGPALVKWARRCNFDPALLESYIAWQKNDVWNDFVAVFIKDVKHVADYSRRIIDTNKEFYNGIVYGSAEFLNPRTETEDLLKIEAIGRIASGTIAIR